MKFYTAKKKQPNVPIVSLLDILAILLIYTVVAFQVKTDEGKSGKGDGVGNAREQAALKVDTPSTDVLATKNVGEKRVQIVIAADGRIELRGVIIDKALLESYLVGLKEEKPMPKLEIKADKEVTLEQWVFMLEALKKAGIPAADVPWLIKDKSKENE